MLTAADYDELLGMRAAPKSAPAAQPQGLGSRIGAQLYNLPKNTALSLGETAGAIGDFFTGKPQAVRDYEAQRMEEERPSMLYESKRIAPSRGVADTTVDVLLGGIAPELPGLLIPAGTVGKGARLLGAGRAAPVIGDVAAGAISGYRDNASEAAMQATEFGGMGAVGALLPRRFSPLLRATAEGAAGYGIGVAGQAARGHDPFTAEAQTQAGVMGALPFAMQGRKLFRRGEVPQAESILPREREVIAPSRDAIPADWVLRNRVETAEGRYDHTFDTPSGEVRITNERPLGNLAEPSQPAGKGGEVKLSVEPQGGAVRDVATETPVPPANRLRPLSRETGAVDSRILAPIAGAVVGGAIDGPEGALVGATVGFAGAAGRRLLRRLPHADTAARQQVTGIGGKTMQGRGVRILEKYFKKGRDPVLDTIGEQARGTVHTLTEDVGGALKQAIPSLKTLNPAQKSALKVYMGSDRGAGAKALLAAARLPAEVVNFVEVATQRKGDLQQILSDAQGDPSRKKLIQDTIGTWVTEPYRAYVNPKEWQKKGVAPAMVDRLVNLNARDPAYRGFSKEQIRADVEKWLRDDVMNFGGDFARMQTEGKSRMSQSLFTKRKTLRPIVQKILGKIHDPIEREVLSVSKLVRSATSAKVVADVLKLPDQQGNRLAMTSSEWNADLQAALAKGDTAKVEQLRGYEQVPDTLPGLGSFSAQNGERMMAQRQVMDMMQAGTPHGNVDWESGWLGALGKLNRIPKAAFTLYNPGTWAHNFVQAPLQAVSAGMAPWSFIANLRRLHADPAKMRWAKEDGIMDAHMGAGEFRRAADQYEKVLNPGKLEPVRRIHEAVKAGYGKPDQWVRGAAYMKFLDEATAAGKSTSEARRFAVEMTNRYTQNYSNVAPAVAIARNIPGVNPFISYTAEMARIVKNLAADVAWNTNGRRLPSALALTTLFGLGAGIKKLVETLTLTDEERQGLATLIPILPEYMRGRTQVGLGNAANGDPRLLNLNPWLPSEDFVTVAKNIFDADFEALKANNPLFGLTRTPALNLYTELTTGKDAVTGQPSGGFLSAIRKQTLPSWLPGGYQAKRLSQGFSRNEEGTLGVTDDRGRTETPGTALAALGGVSISQVNRRKLLSRQKRDQDEQVRQAKTNLNRILRSNVAPDAKEQARAEFAEERRRILGR